MKVLAVSPFFDKAGGNSPFAEMLTDHLGPIPELVLVTDQANIPLLSQKHYGESSRRELYLIPPVISDSECTQIQRVNDGVSVKDLNIVRKLHAKILVLMGKDKSLVYLGSANFTSKAWNGDNQELGIVWVENGNPEKIARMILQNLYASTANQYEKLPEQPAPTCEVDDDEGYNEESGYPNFVQGIVLGYDKERETVRFEFHCDDLVKLHNYVIGWGNLLLIITGKFSQELKANEFYTRLVGGKNLTFRLKPSGDQVFHVPFRHSPELLQQKDQFLFPTSTDWLQFYLGVSRDTSLNPGEFLPGEEVTPLPVETDIGADIDRNSNLVIKMQQYLNLFSGVEKEFTIRAENIKKCAGDKRITELTKTLLQPLETYARILARERDKDTGNMEYCFKMGELVLFCKSLEDKVPEMNAFARQLSSSLHTDHTHNNPVLKTYLHYCKR